MDTADASTALGFFESRFLHLQPINYACIGHVRDSLRHGVAGFVHAFVVDSRADTRTDAFTGDRHGAGGRASTASIT